MSSTEVEQYFELKKKIETEVEFPANFRELIDRASKLHPDTMALNFFDDEQSLTYRELRNNAYALADSLSQQGVKHGSHVALVISNRVEFPVSWLALAVLGAVMVPVNPIYTSPELDYVFNDGDVEFTIIEESFMPLLNGMKKRPRALVDSNIVVIGSAYGDQHQWDELLSRGSADFVPSEALKSEDLLNIQYTSGTTGFPKGCMQTQRYWILLGCVVGHIQDGQIKSVLADMPFFYMDPQWMVVMGLYAGITVHCPRKPSIKKFLDWAETYQVEMAYFPFPLLEVAPSERDAKTPIKMFLGYALDAELTRYVEQRFNAKARDSFGMTEIGPGLMVPQNVDSDAGLSSCGLPVAFREAKVVTEDGKEAAIGEPGELWVKGDGIIKGYYNKPEANEDSFVDGWFRTGDVFSKDKEGFFKILGRIKDMIRRSSENISALEIERALYFLPGIVGVAAIAVPDPRRDEEVKVYLELAEGVTPKDLPPAVVLAHCQKRLAAFKVPRYIEYTTELPWTPSDKVAKHKLIAAKDDLREGSWDEQDKLWR